MNQGITLYLNYIIRLLYEPIFSNAVTDLCLICPKLIKNQTIHRNCDGISVPHEQAFNESTCCHLGGNSLIGFMLECYRVREGEDHIKHRGNEF